MHNYEVARIIHEKYIKFNKNKKFNLIAAVSDAEVTG